MNSKLSCALLALLAMAGCASPYIQPDGPDVASLTFKSDAPSRIDVMSFKVADNYSGGKLRFSGRPLQPGEQSEIKIIPDQTFSFTLATALAISIA